MVDQPWGDGTTIQAGDPDAAGEFVCDCLGLLDAADIVGKGSEVMRMIACCPKCKSATTEWLFKSEMWWCSNCRVIFSRLPSCKAPQGESAGARLSGTLPLAP